MKTRVEARLRAAFCAFEMLETRRLLSAPGNPSPFSGTPVSIPGVIEAENFDTGGEGVAYHDADAVNLGGAYRPGEGVDLQPTTDAGGGYNVGWIRAGEYLDYTVNVATAGRVPLQLRVASPFAGGTLGVSVDGVDATGALAFPNTGGFQNWTTLVTSGIDLTAGTHVLRITFGGSGYYIGNLNGFSVGIAAFGGKPAAVPGIIQAENFDIGGEGAGYHDAEPANLGGQYRPGEGVDIQTTTDSTGGYNVGWTHAGEYLNYSINAPSTGLYDLAVRFASEGTSGVFEILIDGNRVVSTNIGDTGGWQSWENILFRGLPISAGTHIMRVAMISNGPSGYTGNFNFFTFTPSTEQTPIAFDPAVQYAGGGYRVRAADVNKDGNLDLVATGGSLGGTSVLLGNRDGTFQSARQITADRDSDAAIADFTGDGKLDVIADAFSVTLFPGNGDGTFQAPVDLPAPDPGSAPLFEIQPADVNNDGKPDLVGVSYTDLDVYVNQGNNTFQQHHTPLLAPGQGVAFVADFNGDKKLDMAIATTTGLNILLGRGDGFFSTRPIIALQYPDNITGGDFNGDGKLDLAVTTEGNASMSILLGDGNGNFGSPNSVASGGADYGAIAGDFNGDGKLDFATSINTSPGLVQVAFGNGDGTLQPPLLYAAGLSSQGLAVGDFNHDGIPDIASTSAGGITVNVLLSRKSG